MTDWTAEELRRIGDAEELQVATRRSDGSLSRYVTIWVVSAGTAIYIRTAHGTDNPWFRRALKSRAGRIRAGGIERDITFLDADPASHSAIDDAYHAKYDRHGPAIVGSVVGPRLAGGTLQLRPIS